MPSNIGKEYPYLANTTMDVRLLGMPYLLTSFPQQISGSRGDMYNHHQAQAMVLNKPGLAGVFSGLEPQFREHMVEPLTRPHRVKVLRVIPKYRRGFMDNWAKNCPERYVIVETEETNPKTGNKFGRLDVLTISTYYEGANGFGYLPILKNVDKLTVGAYLDPDMIFSHSPGIIGDDYGFGVDLNVIYGSFAETIEDAFVISESAAKKLETTEVKSHIINVVPDRRPLNLYGDDSLPQFLPNIGDFVREDGILCGQRPSHWATVAADADPNALKVIDVTFAANLNNIGDCYPQVERHISDYVTGCCKSLLEVFYQYCEPIGNRPPLLTPTNRMNELFVRAFKHFIGMGGRDVRLDGIFKSEMKRSQLEGFDGRPVEFIQAKVVTAKRRKVTATSKLTDKSGGLH
jgi:hypothetical protein